MYNHLPKNLCYILVLIFVTLRYTVAESNEKKCRSFNSTCGRCIDQNGCFWCGSTSSCHSFNIIPKGCSKAQWYAGQCTIAGFWLIIILPCVALFLIISLICCCWCCCCRKDKGSEEEKFRLKESQRSKEKQQRGLYYEAKDAEREMERNRLRTKYGLYNTEDPPSYKRFDQS